MGGVNVKNTMVERVLQIVAPHPCSGCGKVGAILCLYCKYDIVYEPFLGCILCGRPQMNGICEEHSSPIERAFTVGARTGALESAINRLKFQNTKAAAIDLAELLDARLPILPEGTVIIPVPTVRSHIRQRGYDQVELLAKHLSRLRGVSITSALTRQTTTTQHLVDRKQRNVQAARAFALDPSVPVPRGPVLLLDDIVTTGSTLMAAATQLSQAGVTVWVATLAYQPLD